MPVFEYRGRRVEFLGAYRRSYECINQGRFYEQPFLEYIAGLGLEGTYLDIGTNIANHAIYFSAFCKAEQVIGFEPMESWRERAIRNVEANHCDVKIYPVGLLDRDTDITFNPYGTPFTLTCTTLDALLPDLTGVTFVKMDIEGSEPKAMLGGREFFRRNKPLLFAEVLGDMDEINEAAAAIGYRHTGFRFPGSQMFEFRPVSKLRSLLGFDH